jgi:hypothetical protein
MAKAKHTLQMEKVAYIALLNKVADAAVQADARGWKKPYEVQVLSSEGKCILQVRVLETPNTKTRQQCETRLVDARGVELHR